MSTTGIALDTCLQTCDPAGVTGAVGMAVLKSVLNAEQAVAAQLAASIGLGANIDAYA
ncbi:MAG: hypothetical protein JO192_00545 [Candidatus Eremiobacteraeota bacterium]|nr:hypothetical protein [Candidatus Eremiobacteraeota bacterium]